MSRNRLSVESSGYGLEVGDPAWEEEQVPMLRQSSIRSEMMTMVQSKPQEGGRWDGGSPEVL